MEISQSSLGPDGRNLARRAIVATFVAKASERSAGGEYLLGADDIVEVVTLSPDCLRGIARETAARYDAVERIYEREREQFIRVEARVRSMQAQARDEARQALGVRRVLVGDGDRAGVSLDGFESLYRTIGPEQYRVLALRN